MVPIVRDRCPDCGGELSTITVEQPAIVRHGGYGATRVHSIRKCVDCGWSLHEETSEVRP